MSGAPTRFLALAVFACVLTVITIFSYQPARTDESQFVFQQLDHRPKSYASDRVLVKLRSSKFAKSTFQESGLSFKNSKVLGSGGQTLAVTIDTRAESVNTAIEKLKLNPDVEWAQPDYIYRKSVVPNDENYGLLWGLKNSSQTIAKQHSLHNLYSTGNPGTSGRDMGLESAWSKTTDCSGVVVAVIDTGINLQHADLVDNLWDDGMGNHGYDFINMDNDPTDDEGHGTHVAGTIGARGNNSIGTTGVCWQTKLMGVKVLDESGSGTTSGIIQGVNYAVAQGADVINMSLGGGGSLDLAFRDSIEAASDAGVIIVVAAGNSNVNVSNTATYPCSFTSENLICVGAVDQRYNRATFSNYSQTLVHIAAPGTNIVSSALGPITEEAISLNSGSWSFDATDFGHSTTPTVYLQSPANYDGSAARYGRNVRNHAYGSFNFTSTRKAIARIGLLGSIDSSDALYFAAAPRSGVNPSTVFDGEFIGSYSGSTAGISGTLDITTCSMSQCSFGFELDSLDDPTQSTGIRITSLTMIRYQAGTTGYDTLDGTSMAAPHVAGLAALVKAHNPDFTAAEIRAAVVNTGTKIPALAGAFKSGSVANAANALKYIPKPSAPTVTVD
ncbi:MAG: S8 family serine peptidase [Bdellovibrionales bacterium]|nr:S8 family serine peptidase [Bdellovibrionales bacterium]